MTSVMAMPRGALTAEDFLAWDEAEDGWRYELLDGMLLVSPAPHVRHQVVLQGIYEDLRVAVSPDLQILWAPVDVVLGADTVLQPDLIVVPRGPVGARIERPPDLAVEVLSPSTRIIDLTAKWARYEQSGVSSYWVVDPTDGRLRVWDLADGSYTAVADTTGEVMVDRPFPLALHPARWV